VSINFQTNGSGTKTKSEQCAEVVVNEDATKSKQEEFVGNMETELYQQINVRQRVYRKTLQVRNEVESIFV